MTAVLSPCGGTVHPLSEAPDPVFSAEMVGSGVFVDPDRERTTVVAPVAGKVLKVHPHAFVVLGADGGVLVHLGIDTVKLDGEGFDVLVAEKSTVAAGDPMITWDPAAVAAQGLSPAVMIAVMDTKPGTYTSERLGEHVAAGEELFAL